MQFYYEDEKYREEFCVKLIEHLSKGLSYSTFGATVNVTKQTLYDWEKKHFEWKRAKDIGMQKAQQFFETRLVAISSGQTVRGIDNKKVDTKALMFALKTRFREDYREEKDVNHTVSAPKLIIDMNEDKETDE